MPLIFVFGTLKRGFALHAKLAGARFLGTARTRKPFPMFVAGRIFGPMMLDREGRGRRVRGELYEVSEKELAAVDKAEDVGWPGSFRRPVAVETAGRETVQALAFFKDARLATPAHTGYLEDYHDGRFRPPGHRPSSMPPLRLLSCVTAAGVSG